MPWEGLSSESEIREETLVYFFKQFKGLPLMAGMEIQVRTPASSWLKVLVTKFADSEILELKTSDGAVWHLTPMRASDSATVACPNSRAQAWVVRSKVPR